MSPLTHGADAVRLRESGQALLGIAERLRGIGASGQAMSRTLDGCWIGPDLERFTGQHWPAAEKAIHASAEMVSAMGDAAVRNAAEQDTASEGGGGGASGGAGDGGVSDAGQSRDPDEYGDLPEGVRDAWATYSEEEKKDIIEQIIRERAEHYGIDMPSIDWDEDMSGNGRWNEGILWGSGTVTLNPGLLEDPMIMHTVYHEVRHAAQHEAIRDADTFWWWEDPEYNHGMTPEEVAEWKENFDDYQSAPKKEEWDEDRAAAQEKYDAYFNQPVEVDARAEGAEFVEALTPEELERLHEASQVDPDAPQILAPGPLPGDPNYTPPEEPYYADSGDR